MYTPRLARLLLLPRAAAPRMSTNMMSTQHGRPLPSKDEINTSSKESTRSGTNDEVAHANEAAYGSATNPVEERKVADMEGEKTSRPGSLEYSPANPQVSHQGGEDKSPTKGTKDARKTSGGSRNAT